MSATPFGVLFLLTGSICLVGSVYWFINSVHLVTTSQWATGRVTRVITRHWRRSRDSFYPVFVFTDGKGIRHTVRSATGSRPASQRVGDTVTVLYTPGDEQHARIYSMLGVWIGPFVVLFFGIAHTCFGALLTGLWWPGALIRFLRPRRALGSY